MRLLLPPGILAHEFQKEFNVVAADREAVKRKDWQTVLPRAETGDAVILKFPESLDHALLQRMIFITNSNHDPIQGEIQISNLERKWTYKPLTQ